MHYVMDKSGYVLELESFFKEINEYDIIFIGEVHDLPECQEAELTILRGLSEREPDLVLGLEMFERDVQDALDDYLGAVIPEETFLKLSRPWPHYEEGYRPLIEFAKARQLAVIAANVPRRAAAAVAKTNQVSVDVLAGDGRFVPDVIHYDSAEYRERFTEMVAQMTPSAPMKSRSVDGLYKAQVVKDAVMAAALEPFLGRRILFCCGRFHCDYHLGIPYQLHRNHPELKIAVLTFATLLEGLPMSERSRVGDYIWIVK
ncbi:MAG: ChaN family lipoprotein [Thermodesulfobacteriota bacterium]|nr:ChaN family lipoprotein [Thermodesulfobacteriota bacterium]